MPSKDLALLRALVVEDNPNDVELLIRELKRSGFTLTYERVDTEKDLRAALDAAQWDIVLSDFSLPQFDGLKALAICKKKEPDLPFLIISGTIGEETAVDAMRSGANDYLLKSNLSRLGPAVEREVEEARKRLKQKKAQKVLARTQRYNAALLDAIPDTVFHFRRDGYCLDYIPSGSEKLIPQLAEARGRMIQDVFDSESTENITAALERAIAGAGVQEIDIELSGPVGVRNFEARIRAIGTQEAVLFLRDVTEQRSVEAQFRAAQRMEAVGRLAGGVAHDFNNLLTAIYSFTRFAMEGMSQHDPARSDLQEVIAAAARAEDLTTQLLTFSRRRTVEPKVVDITDLTAGMERMLQRILGEDIDFNTHLFEDLWHCKLDPGALEQVVVNLAVNARDAMPSGGKLTIETQNESLDPSYGDTHGVMVPPGDYVVVIVTDNGMGMDKQTQDRIFEPFYTTKGEGKGTGLGLSTCYGIVKQANGFIWVYSEIGKGTTFKVYLPRVIEDVDTIQTTQRTEIVGGTETILVVEDDKQVRMLAVRSLKRLGYTVLEASNGAEALLLAEGFPHIHLLLTDVVMPQLGGKELVDRLGKRYHNTKVLYMSGYTANAIMHQGVLDEGVALLQKPFTPDLVALKVREVLDAAGEYYIGTHRRRLLIVDDDPRILAATKRLLKDEYDVTIANGGVPALQLLATQDFDHILCDAMMPDLNGGELLEKVKELRPVLAERFVFITGIAGRELVDSLAEESGHRVLPKPLSRGQLSTALRMD